MSDSDKEDVFEVEDILEHKVTDGRDFYLVKWKGYADTTWEPDENIGEELRELKVSSKGGRSNPKASEKDKKKEKKSSSKKDRKPGDKKERRRRRCPSSSSSSESPSSSSDERARKKKKRRGSADPEDAAWQQQAAQQQAMQQQMMQQWQAHQQAVQYHQQMQQWQYAQHMQAQAHYQQQQAAHHHQMVAMQQEEERRRMEEMRRKEEEDRRHREEDQKRQAAKATIMQAVEKMRTATPETFDGLKKELDEVYGRELKNTGAPVQQLIYEKEKSLEAARKNVEKIKIQRKIAEQAAILEHATAVVKATVPVTVQAGAAPGQKEFFKSKPATPPPAVLASMQAVPGASATS